MTGLDYYNARYYDPVANQFVSADTILLGDGYDILGLSRYAYVEGNPESRTDPSGHFGVPAPIMPVNVPVPELGPELKVLLGGAGVEVAASSVAETTVGGVVATGAGLLALMGVFGVLFSSSSGPDYQSDQPDVYQRNRPQRPDAQRRVVITPNRLVTQVEVDRWEVGLQLKVRNAEQTPGGSGQGRIPPGYGRFAMIMLILGVAGAGLTYVLGFGDVWETHYPAFPPAPAPTPPTPGTQPPDRTERNLK